MTVSTTTAGTLHIDGDRLRAAGNWTLPHLAGLEHHIGQLSVPPQASLEIDASGLQHMDTAGAWLLQRTRDQLRQQATVTLSGLREEHQALMAMIEGHGGTPQPAYRPGLLEGIGRESVRRLGDSLGFLSFVGEFSLVFAHVVTHPGRLRLRVTLNNLQATGFFAMPIVALLSFLVGVVIAYQGAVQLQRFGANIFIADLVGLSMLRELAPMITAIIVAGRSGSAFTAQIGTMKVTEEIDALRTIGVPPLELLVLPKVLAMLLALPLLTVFADALGVFGGMVMAQAQLDIGFQDFFDRLGQAVEMQDFLIGLGKAPVFALIIALVGCFQGFKVSGSADSVGRQTTVSVVQSIFLIIVVDAVFSVIFSWLGL